METWPKIDCMIQLLLLIFKSPDHKPGSFPTGMLNLAAVRVQLERRVLGHSPSQRDDHHTPTQAQGRPWHALQRGMTLYLGSSRHRSTSYRKATGKKSTEGAFFF